MSNSGFQRLKTLDPALLRAFIYGVLTLVAGLGVTGLTDNKINLVWGVAAAVLALFQGVSIKSAVTPNSKVIAYLEDPFSPNSSTIVPGEAKISESRGRDFISSIIDRKNDHDI